MLRNMSLSKRPPAVWGNTDFPEETRALRIYVKGFKVDTTTIDDLLNFFNRQGIKGIKIIHSRGHAIVEFDRPSYFEAAKAKLGMELNGRLITIEPDRSSGSKKPRRVTPPSCKGNQMAVGRELSRRSTSCYRGRSRSPSRHSHSRSYERSPEHRYRDDRNSPAVREYAGGAKPFLQSARFGVSSFQASHIPGLKATNPAVGESILKNYTGFSKQDLLPLPTRPTQPPPHPSAAFYQTNHAQIPQQQYVAPQMPQMPIPVPTSNGVTQLPSSISWALQMILSQNTVRNLSIDKIQDVIEFLEAEKKYLLQHHVINNSSTNTYSSQPQQHQQQQLQQQQPQPQQQPVQESQESADNQEEDSQTANQDELKKLADVMRMLSEHNRR